MTVRELMQRMDSREFGYWRAELQLRHEEELEREAARRAEASAKSVRSRRR